VLKTNAAIAKGSRKVINNMKPLVERTLIAFQNLAGKEFTVKQDN
jgi:hypothetical protein